MKELNLKFRVDYIQDFATLNKETGWKKVKLLAVVEPGEMKVGAISDLELLFPPNHKPEDYFKELDFISLTLNTD